MILNKKTDLLVIGAGPGGYTAAMRASDLGMKVILVNKYDSVGGVCLNVGCVPSKSLLYLSKVVENFKIFSKFKVFKQNLFFNIDYLRKWKVDIVNKINKDLKLLIKNKKIEFLVGYGYFLDSNTFFLKNKNSTFIINFRYAIIATGSKSFNYSNFYISNNKIIDSTEALLIKVIPKNLLIVGGGAIGIELGIIYNILGSKVVLVEKNKSFIKNFDNELSGFLFSNLKKYFDKILFNTNILNIVYEKNLLNVYIKTYFFSEKLIFDSILFSCGRYPNTFLINTEKIGLLIDKNGFILVDDQQRTNISNLFAVGDVTGYPMLAHKAIFEGKLAAEVICGAKNYFISKYIPFVIYSNPSLSYVGFFEDFLKTNNFIYKKIVFSWKFNATAIILNCEECVTKILYSSTSNKILGAGIVGFSAEDLISEFTLAMELDCSLIDILYIIHPHPSLSEIIYQSVSFI